MEVRRQFSGCIIQAQAKKIGSQVDDVPVRSAGKTVVVVVCYQQAGVVVVVEGAEPEVGASFPLEFYIFGNDADDVIP